MMSFFMGTRSETAYLEMSKAGFPRIDSVVLVARTRVHSDSVSIGVTDTEGVVSTRSVDVTARVVSPQSRQTTDVETVWVDHDGTDSTAEFPLTPGATLTHGIPEPTMVGPDRIAIRVARQTRL
jgi:hypothetical protein